MKKYHVIALLMTTILISGCINETSSTENLNETITVTSDKNILGEWAEDSCVYFNSVGGKYFQRWYVIEQYTLTIYPYFYDNSSCAGDVVFLHTLLPVESFSYTTGNSVTTSSGLKAKELNLVNKADQTPSYSIYKLDENERLYFGKNNGVYDGTTKERRLNLLLTTHYNRG